MNDKNLKIKNTTGGGTCKYATILLTGTINPRSFNRDSSKPNINVALDKALERLVQYENAVSKYITESYFTDIVFVENSGYPFLVEKYVKLAEEHGKRFEFLYRELSDDEVAIMQEKGKGWGEADLIDYAMINSKLIAETDTVYKVTGRVFLKNSKQILKNAHNESEFMRFPKLNVVKTYFFKILKKDYFDYLQTVKDDVDDYKPENSNWYDKKTIEACYFKKIKESNMRVKMFKRFPDLDGVMASDNKIAYNSHWYKRVIYNILPIFLKKSWKIKD